METEPSNPPHLNQVPPPGQVTGGFHIATNGPASSTSPRKRALEERDWQIAERFHRLSNASYISIRVLSFVLHRSVASLWRDVAAGRLPQPVKIGPNSTRFLVGSIREALRSRQTQSDYGHGKTLGQHIRATMPLVDHSPDYGDGNHDI